jgi:hypothetical protein
VGDKDSSFAEIAAGRRAMAGPPEPNLLKALDRLGVEPLSGLIICCGVCASRRPELAPPVVAAVVSSRATWESDRGRIVLWWFDLQRFAAFDEHGKRRRQMGWYLSMHAPDSVPNRARCDRCGSWAQVGRGEMRRRLASSPAQMVLCSPHTGLGQAVEPRSSHVKRKDNAKSARQMLAELLAS